MNGTLSDLAQDMKGELVAGDPAARLGVLRVDSRGCIPGDVFVAIKGARVDGHSFAVDLNSRGVHVVVSERGSVPSPRAGVIAVPDTPRALTDMAAAHRARFAGPVFGITGSNGKTTCKQMLSSILSRRSPGLWTEGNRNSQIGLPLVLSELDPRHRWIVLEMGASEKGNIAALCRVARPTAGILTSLGPAHIATFGSMEGIARAKWELMQSLPQEGTAVVPFNEPLISPLIGSLGRKVVTFGFDDGADMRAVDVDAGPRIAFTLVWRGDKVRVSLPVPGRHNVTNALAAAAAAVLAGGTLNDARDGLEAFTPAAMRLEVGRHPQGAILVNDAYNANPASMRKSIESLLEAYPRHRKALVIGAMLELGADSARYHRELGAYIATTGIERVVVVGDDARPAMETLGGDAVFAATAADAAPHLAGFLSDGAIIWLKGSRGIQLENLASALGFRAAAKA